MKIALPSLLGQLRDPRFLNWKSVTALAAVLAAGYFLYRSTATVLFAEENAAAGYEISRALETFKLNSGRYPEKLALLQPRYIPEVPKPEPGTSFVYAVSSDGKECFFAYQVSRGGLNEYDCGTKRWGHYDYEDSSALRATSKEFVMGPKG
jgi:hypothetical protein